jgi:hypothetical protein
VEKSRKMRRRGVVERITLLGRRAASRRRGRGRWRARRELDLFVDGFAVPACQSLVSSIKTHVRRRKFGGQKKKHREKKKTG